MSADSNIRSATSILTELRDGHVITELSGALHDAIAAVLEHNKSAEVLLRITISPFNETKLVEPAITMTAVVDRKLPKEVPPATLFFPDEGGNPQRSPVRQKQMPFTVAPSTSNESGA